MTATTPKNAAAGTANPYLAETAVEILKLIRAPEFIAPTLVLPVVFYTLFGVIIPAAPGAPAYLLATFGVFAVMGPALFGFGAGVAQERERGWLKLKRAAPAPAASYVAAKTIATMIMAAAALALVYVSAAALAGVALPRENWAALLGVHLAAVLPFAFLGLALGFSLGSNAAVAVANLLFLAFAVAGGLWIPVDLFPAVMQDAAWFLPSFHLGELALWAAGDAADRPVALHAAAAAGMTGLFALLAVAAWLRQR